MDPTAYKTLTTTRGILYNYYVSPPIASNPILFFIHGFPSSSYDWRHQIHFFKARGYGLIVPDMLGYGGTDKPTDPTLYALSLVSKDLVDILDAEKVDKVVAIGHDWGSIVASRLANLYTDRFTAFGFLAVSYTVPSPGVKYEDILAYTKRVAGYELLGYWKFFSEPDAHKTIVAHFDSWCSILFAEDAKLWMTDVAPTGALKTWTESNQMTPVGSFISSEELQVQKEILLKGGLQGPLCWYKTMTSDISSEDAKSIPPSNYVIHKPVFFGGAKKDFVAISSGGKAATTQFCKGDLTIHEFDAAHWLIWEVKEELNEKLLVWVESLK